MAGLLVKYLISNYPLPFLYLVQNQKAKLLVWWSMIQSKNLQPGIFLHFLILLKDHQLQPENDNNLHAGVNMQFSTLITHN